MSDVSEPIFGGDEPSTAEVIAGYMRRARRESIERTRRISPAAPVAAAPAPSAVRSWSRRLYLAPILLVLTGVVLLEARGCTAGGAPVPRKKAAPPAKALTADDLGGEWSVMWDGNDGRMSFGIGGVYSHGDGGYLFVGRWEVRDGRLYVVEAMLRSDGSYGAWVEWSSAPVKDGAGWKGAAEGAYPGARWSLSPPAKIKPDA